MLIAAAVTACASGPADTAGPALTPTVSETATTPPATSTAPSAVPATSAANHAVAPPAKRSDVTPQPSPTVYRCEGNAVAKPSWLNLACADQKMGIDQLHWSGWGSATARATGRFWEYDCVPDCTSGKLVSVRTSVTVSGLADGHYTRLHVTATPPPAQPHDYLLTKAGPEAA
ncbi:hypothetical protein GCM10009565_50340 [Amycolatopsis albidoflavus]